MKPTRFQTEFSDQSPHPDADDWERLQDLYHLLAATPVGERESILQAAGPDLAARASSLLVSSVTVTAAPASEMREPPYATRIGPYAILRHLGSGGVGSVFLTERTVAGIVQQCALKILRVPSLEASFRVRFQREQQILATLDHPNITRLLDAGLSDTGQPYLVMEFVDGLNFNQFCDEHRLAIRQRLKLFLNVCDALIYAHRNLIVHLDLKPSNILVAADGTVKLLDFGTSKLIAMEGTTTTTLSLTPTYASPEQLRGEPPTTACDIYSLGVMLYELLSGQRPFQTSSLAMAMFRAAQEREPARITAVMTGSSAEARGLSPRRLRSQLEGDLDAIVARCMRGRPKDRYGSVDALADDLRRHLEGRPVSARRQTISYRVARFIRRNAGSVAISITFLLLLLCAGTFAYMREQHAIQEGRRAEQMQTFLAQLFKLANQNYTGKPAATVPEFLQLGVKVLPEFIKNAADRRSAQLSLGESMFDSQDFQHALPVLQDVALNARDAGDAGVEAEAEAFGGMAASNLGKTDQADQMTERALTLSHARGVSAPARIWVEGYYALTHSIRSFDSAKSIALLQAAVEESSSAGVPERERLWVLERLALLDQTRGDLTSASKLAQQALDIVNREPYALCDRSIILELQANLMSLQGDDAGSLPAYKQAVETAGACSGPGTVYTLAILDLEARATLNAGRTKNAISLLEAAMPAWRKAVGRSQNISVPLTFLARAYVLDGDFEEAATAAREALQVQEGKVNVNSTRVGMCHLLLAQALAGQQRTRSALAEAEVAKSIYAAVPNMSPIEKSFQTQTQLLITSLLQRTGSSADADKTQETLQGPTSSRR